MSSFRAEDKAKKVAGNYQATGLTYSAFKIEEVCFIEAFVNSYQTAHLEDVAATVRISNLVEIIFFCIALNVMKLTEKMSASITFPLLFIYERLLSGFSYGELENREMQTNNRLESVKYSSGI